MSELCLSCGLCCSGLLFSRASVHAEEIEGLAAVGIRVQRYHEKGDAFPLPCVAHRNGCCSVYESRPEVCRKYRCELLKDVDAGRTSLAKAHEVVATTKGLIGAIEKHLPIPAPTENPSSRLVALVQRLQVGARNGTEPPALALDVALLTDMIARYFLPRGRVPAGESMETAAPESND